MDLNTMAFLLLAALLATYAVLDGFDLGVGILSLFARSKEERDLHVAAIGPVWDGNEVWLLASGNVLFGAFPAVFATVFGGFYLALVLVLVALVARAVSIEFRLLHPSTPWLRTFDLCFGLGSLVPAVLFGVAVGNVLRGVPLGPDLEWRGSFLGLLNPYALLVGLVGCAFFVMHGALYLRGKVPAELGDRLRRIALASHAAFVALYAAATLLTIRGSPALFAKAGSPLFVALVALLALALAAIPIATAAGRVRLAFAASSATIALVIMLAALSLHPVLVPSTLGAGLSLTIYNAASTPGTLRAMLAIACAGVPLIAAYTFAIYRVFRGQARAGAHAGGIATDPECG
ncbi:MAG: cytochrome d ubiquinol oxidase subunit II [Anaeromyxobacteraceae bacterium]